MATDPLVTHLDFLSGANEVGPVGSVRLTRSATGIQVSVDGGAVGLPFAPASASSAGTMSAADFAKLAELSPAYTAIIDFTAVAATTIAPGVANKVFLPTKIGYLITSTSGTPTTQVTASMGDNASNYNNVLASTAGFPTTAAMIQFQTVNNSGVATTQTRVPGADFKVNITAGAAGTGGFTLLGRYWAIGMYIPSV